MARGGPIKNPASIEDSDASLALLSAAEACLRKYGYAGLSTRKVAEMAEMPLSQIHYHFGTKKNLLLEVFRRHNARLLERQARMFGEQLPLWRRWEQACAYLDEDIESGYVRVLQELAAAGYSDPEIAGEFRGLMGRWFDLLVTVASEAGERFGGLGPFDPKEMAALIGAVFMGAETMMLVGFTENDRPIRAALRKFGDLIKLAEEKAADKQSET
ncbi:MAG: TetR/AcrR family transcriptional regulator [SAR324 cluster bacterium]|nr:TetR/AcrR family transcriptional regulator [SAR324 cluster bacterium]